MRELRQVLYQAPEITLGAVMVRIREPILDVLRQDIIRSHHVLPNDKPILEVLLIQHVVVQIKSSVQEYELDILGQCVI